MIPFVYERNSLHYLLWFPMRSIIAYFPQQIQQKREKGAFRLFLASAPRPALRRWAFWTLSSFCARAALRRWAFSVLFFFYAQPPSSALGFLDTFFLLRPAPLFGVGLFGHFLPPAPSPLFSAGLFQLICTYLSFQFPYIKYCRKQSKKGLYSDIHQQTLC